ncbi:MAG: hypothetical protein K9J79_05030 [Desulfobacteraceae bacterium]|nr:hypothetical protein [Desulfobacteraceae bacterium]
MSPEGISPVRMNGLRMSGPQIKLQQIFPDEGNPRRVPFYQALAADRINISFLCADYSGPVKKLICMAEPATLTRLGGGLTKDSGISGNIDTQAACLISIFPHRFNPAAVGTILHAFSRDNSSWHCMATSGSMVSLTNRNKKSYEICGRRHGE